MEKLPGARLKAFAGPRNALPWLQPVRNLLERTNEGMRRHDDQDFLRHAHRVFEIRLNQEFVRQWEFRQELFVAATGSDRLDVAAIPIPKDRAGPGAQQLHGQCCTPGPCAKNGEQRAAPFLCVLPEIGAHKR